MTRNVLIIRAGVNNSKTKTRSSSKFMFDGIAIDGRAIYHLPFLSKLINHTLHY